MVEKIKFKQILNRLQQQINIKKFKQISNSYKMSLFYSSKQKRLLPRQPDCNIPTYRIIPYKSTIYPNSNDYYLNTIFQLKQQVKKINQDYRNLCQVMWRVFGQIDGVDYHGQVGFPGLPRQAIYDKILLLRNVTNPYKVDQLLQEESLKLSAIYRVDQSHQYSQIAINNDKQFKILTNDLNQIKNESLYQIQEQQQLQTTSKNYPQAHQQPPRLTMHRKSFVKQQKQIQLHRLSLSSHKPRRSSILLKEKISLAFHQQQELRQILQEELESLVKELNQKNQCLRWTLQELQVRNQSIYQLRNTLIQRDLLLERNLIHSKQSQQSQQQQHQLQHINSQQKVQQHNMKIGNLINSLIQRTQQTYDDFQYLIKSLTINQNISPQKLQINQSQLINDVHDIEQRVSEEELNKSFDKSLPLGQIFYGLKINNTNDQIFMIQMISPDKQDNDENHISTGNHQKPTQLQTQTHQQSNQEFILQQKNMNTNSPKSKVVLLTKQHFLNAQKKYPKSPKEVMMFKNVQMTQSLQGDENLL